MSAILKKVHKIDSVFIEYVCDEIIKQDGTKALADCLAVGKLTKATAKKKARDSRVKGADLKDLKSAFGAGYMSRPTLSKILWHYIKANDLQDSKDKRKIKFDSNLKKGLKTGTSVVDMMKLATKISNIASKQTYDASEV